MYSCIESHRQILAPVSAILHPACQASRALIPLKQQLFHPKRCQTASRNQAPLPAPSALRVRYIQRLHRAACLRVQAASTDTDTSVAATPGDHVKVRFVGTFENGEVFDASGDDGPRDFIIGSGKAIKGLEAAVIGLKVGDQRKKTVPPEEGFGEWREEMLLKVPERDIPVGMQLQVGERVMLGNGMEATVKEVSKEEIVLDCNHPSAGKTLNLEVELLELTKADNFAMATFGAGCFWGPELVFARVPGVLATEVGYSQGGKKNPSYEDVCSGLTGHNEVVKVTYDADKVQYSDLLEAFISNHNPTQVDAQGMDRGTQYRSGIYTHTADQKTAAREFLSQAQSRFQDPIATEVEDVQNYWPAEDYHQQYLVKGGRFGNAQSDRKGCTDPIRCYG